MPAEGAPYDRETVADAVAACMAAIEIADSRNADFAEVDAAMLIADNAMNAGCVVGKSVEHWRDLDLAALSRSHRTPETDRFLADYTIKAELTAGSALKFGVVASGEADMYPRLGRTWEWDTAAGHAVVAAAGGSVRTLDGDELGYGKPSFLNPPFVVRGLDA